jgi:LysR family transcriptional regulator, glycine cleavage system transcriptional activator
MASADEPTSSGQFSRLVAFEAAARHGSFTRAAEELRLSQPAISHAIRALEEQLGVSLFERRHKGVHATEAGAYLREQVAMGLTLVEQALREVRQMSSASQVTLSSSTATATWWLLPRIARFKQAHPEVELRCITSDLDLDIERAGIDLAIEQGYRAQGAGEFPRNRRWRFVDEEVFPVCSPRYLERHAERHGAMSGPTSLTRATLLHLEERYRPRLDWTGWLARFGVKPMRGGRQFSFNDYGVVLQAALEGQGVALGWRHIVAPLLAEGRLVRPVAESVTTDNPIYLIAARSGHLRSAAVKLRDWLLAEARGKG